MPVDKTRLIYLPLGGAGEIGMNMYVYGFGLPDQERFILVDVGVTFGDMESSPGIDLIMADPDWISARSDRLEAIFITHAHEDHVGAIGILWPRLKAKVYARRFTAAVAQEKMDRAGHDVMEVRQTNAWPHMVEAGPFRVGFVPISHSIPEASALLIETPAGRILHTGDFKADPTPVVGEPFHPETLKSIGDRGIRALVCDSTNVFSSEPGRSEAILPEAIRNLLREAPGRVVATTFASNVARLKTLAEAGRAAGRQIVILGRAMQTMLRIAEATEVLKGFPPIVDASDAADIPRENLLIIATGSQGERRAATAQLAAGKYLGIELSAGDLVLFSSKTIPGNEVAVARVLNQFSRRGVDTIDDSSGRFHVSGHPNQPDLIAMHDFIRADIVVPMHGEHRHLSAHAKLVRRRGLTSAIVPNGTIIDLSDSEPKVIGEIETGRLYRDGAEVIGARDGIVRERLRIAMRGIVIVSVIVDERGQLLGGVWVEALGLPDDPRLHNGLEGALEDEIEAALRRSKPSVLDDDGAMEDLIQRTSMRVCSQAIDKKPFCKVMISRLAE
ncbi:MAG: ribonuclease J [Pseudomonadota bacterium]